jgi:hypothetical protein
MHIKIQRFQRFYYKPTNKKKQFYLHFSGGSWCAETSNKEFTFSQEISEASDGIISSICALGWGWYACIPRTASCGYKEPHRAVYKCEFLEMLRHYEDFAVIKPFKIKQNPNIKTFM